MSTERSVKGFTLRGNVRTPSSSPFWDVKKQKRGCHRASGSLGHSRLQTSVPIPCPPGTPPDLTPGSMQSWPGPSGPPEPSAIPNPLPRAEGPPQFYGPPLTTLAPAREPHFESHSGNQKRQCRPSRQGGGEWGFPAIIYKTQMDPPLYSLQGILSSHLTPSPLWPRQGGSTRGPRPQA